MNLKTLLRRYGLQAVAALVIGALVLAILLFLYVPLLRTPQQAPGPEDTPALLPSVGSDDLQPRSLARPSPTPEPRRYETAVSASPDLPLQVAEVANGLLRPAGMAWHPQGALLIAEAGTGLLDQSAGLSLRRPDGTVGRLVSGLFSRPDATGLPNGVRVHVSPDGERMLYMAETRRDRAWILPLADGSSPTGPQLPLGPLPPWELAPALVEPGTNPLAGPVEIGFQATGALWIFQATPGRLLLESSEGRRLWSGNLGTLADPAGAVTSVTTLVTGLDHGADRTFVTLAAGCPFPRGSGQLMALNPGGELELQVGGLDTPVDVAVGPDGTVWILEFGTFLPGGSCTDPDRYVPGSGRLRRLAPDGSAPMVLTQLDSPAGVLVAPDGTLYISEFYPGRILRIRPGLSPEASTPQAGSPADRPRPAAAPPAAFPEIPEAVARARLQRILPELDLHPYPGQELATSPSPLTELGRALFFDPVLSGDQNIACATCHHPRFAMADGRALPIGAGGVGLGPERRFLAEVNLGPEAATVHLVEKRWDGASPHATSDNLLIDQLIPRNSPTIINSALLPLQFWDGRVQRYSGPDPVVVTLEEQVNQMALTDPLIVQALFPVISQHEMAGITLGGLPAQTIRNRLLDRLRAIPAYVTLFEAAFAEEGIKGPEAVTLERMVAAIAAFERLFIFTRSPWDDYLAGQHDALSPQAVQGALLFFGATQPSVNCAVCHAGDLFTDLAFHNILAPQLGPGKGHGYSRYEDWGRGRVTFDRRDQHAFRTPSLRNVDLTAPYFHSGTHATLESALRHHVDIWQAARTYDPAEHGISAQLAATLRPLEPERQAQTVAPQLSAGLPLTDPEIDYLIAFLQALTDPAARDLSAHIPTQVPSGLQMDPPAAPNAAGEPKK